MEIKIKIEKDKELLNVTVVSDSPDDWGPATVLHLHPAAVAQMITGIGPCTTPGKLRLLLKEFLDDEAEVPKDPEQPS